MVDDLAGLAVTAASHPLEGPPLPEVQGLAQGGNEHGPPEVGPDRIVLSRSVRVTPYLVSALGKPIKDWLEIEIGTAPLFGHGHPEWDTDVLFKKPFTLSDKVEFMVGAGPQWSQPTNGA
jgi:hypothetical protein